MLNLVQTGTIVLEPNRGVVGIAARYQRSVRFQFSQCVLAARVACFHSTSSSIVILDTRSAASFFTRVFVHGSSCTTFEFPVELSRCDVDKCQRRFCGSGQSISILGTPIADSKVGSFLQQVLVEKHVDQSIAR